ncbi:MAG TPA: hypothetical protein VGP02_11645 [Mycobacteriales bacterium]|nr:hypothetical protein [Mycobacteriales bacterium]
MTYLWGPLVAVGVVGVLALVLRWAHAGSQPIDYGMLAEVATVPDLAAAHELRALLSDAGIRSTLSTDRTGRTRVLVFPGDARRARELVL